MRNKFKLKATDEVTHFLGLDIHKKSTGEILVTQTQFIEKILNLFEMMYSKEMDVPNYANVVPTEKGEGFMPENKKLYQSIIGSLMYLSNGTCPDISYAVGRLASRMSNPSKRNLTQAKGVLRYLKLRIMA